MREEILYFIWQLQYFNKQQVSTTLGQSLSITAPGTRNAHAGPDFENARLYYDGIEWVGSIEIHVNASEWNAHGHQHDAAYNRVVLHVVWEDDKEVFRQDGTTMPTLVLKDRVATSILQNYQRLVFQSPEQQAIPCASLLPQVDHLKKVSMLEQAAVLRLQQKSQEVLRQLKKNKGDWSVTAYQTLVRSFGFRVNTAPFEQLSLAVPLALVMKYQADFQALVAMLLGQAGLLEHADWPTGWKDSYQFLSQKHQLTNQLTRSQWRFFRTRPANFPTKRIVQLAALLHSHSADPTLFYDHCSRPQYNALFERSCKHLPEDVGALGQESIHKILINAVIPYQFAYGSFFQQQALKDQALTLLQSLPAEKNQLVSKFRNYGFPLKSALDTQAALELHRNFCEKKRCLSCVIGVSIIKNHELFVTSGAH